MGIWAEHSDNSQLVFKISQDPLLDLLQPLFDVYGLVGDGTQPIHTNWFWGDETSPIPASVLREAWDQYAACSLLFEEAYDIAVHNRYARDRWIYGTKRFRGNVIAKKRNKYYTTPGVREQVETQWNEFIAFLREAAATEGTITIS